MASGVLLNTRLWLGVTLAAVVAVTATGALGGSGGGMITTIAGIGQPGSSDDRPSLVALSLGQAPRPSCEVGAILTRPRQHWLLCVRGDVRAVAAANDTGARRAYRPRDAIDSERRRDAYETPAEG